MAPSGPVAILGATSRMARDFVLHQKSDAEVRLYARNPGKLAELLAQTGRPDTAAGTFSDFGREHYAAIINFVGVGDPARAKEMGAEIFAVTREFDLLA